MNIGDSRNTLLWHDPCIHGVPGFCVVRPPNYPLHVNWVANLMDQRCLMESSVSSPSFSIGSSLRYSLYISGSYRHS